MGKMTKAEAGRLGGLKTKSRYGSTFFSAIGKKGGSKGGKKILSLYGKGHMREIGRKGGLR